MTGYNVAQCVAGEDLEVLATHMVLARGSEAHCLLC